MPCWINFLNFHLDTITVYYSNTAPSRRTGPWHLTAVFMNYGISLWSRITLKRIRRIFVNKRFRNCQKIEIVVGYGLVNECSLVDDGPGIDEAHVDMLVAGSRV